MGPVLTIGCARRCTRKPETDSAFAVASVDGTGIQGDCGLGWRG